jgi:choline dehydrogenase-like flavoprotein
MTNSINENTKIEYDFIIIGSGVSGSFIANELSNSGYRSLIIEAGDPFDKFSYPEKEIDANSKLYWNGGIELNKSADIGLLRPKCVGGGSIVNQALLDRFDEIALESWRTESKIDFFDTAKLAKYYDKAESELEIETIEEKNRNGNAKIFQEGFKANGYQCAPLKRAQKGCNYSSGNDCISCLSGCKRDSKQSTPVTTLFKALQKGSTLITGAEIQLLKDNGDHVLLISRSKSGIQEVFKSKACVLAAGAIGNTKILLNSGFKESHPALGEYFFTH